MDAFNLSGRTLGQYRLQRLIGTGGMAQVYLAVQPALNRNVAVKVMAPNLADDEGFATRFRREATMVASMLHPNILTVHDFGEELGLLYLVMAYVPGGTLHERMQTPLEWTAIVKIVSQIADGLDYAHELGIVHRDLKPNNIFMVRPDYPLVGDFGIARLIEAGGLTMAGTTVGTPEYMSPEQGLGKPVDGRSDIYALGIILYKLLTGRVPFTGNSGFSIIHQHVYDPPPPLSSLRPGIPPGLEAVTIRALAKQPEDRYQTAGQFKQALEQALGGNAYPPMPFASPEVGTQMMPSGPSSAPQSFGRPSQQIPPASPPSSQGYVPPASPLPSQGYVPPASQPPGQAYVPPPVSPASSQSYVPPPPAYVPPVSQPPYSPPSSPAYGQPPYGQLSPSSQTAYVPPVVPAPEDDYIAVPAGEEPKTGWTPVVLGVVVALAVLCMIGSVGLIVAWPQITQGNRAAEGNPSPTAGPTQPAGPTAGPTVAVGQVLFQDPMQANQGRWPVGSNAGGQSSFVNGAYQIQTTPANQTNIMLPLATVTFTNFVYDADFKKVAGPETATYGVAFRVHGEDSWYELLVTGDQKMCLALWVNTLKGYDYMLPCAQNTAIKSGNETNKLRIVANGPEISVYVNDTLAGKVTETRGTVATYGGIGLTAGPGVTVAVSNVKVSAPG